MRNLLSIRPSCLARTAVLLVVTLLSFQAFANDSNLEETLKGDYPLTKVGISMLKWDYNRITQPGIVLTVRVPGIYADVAGTTQAIVNTSIENGQASQQRGFLASLSKTGQSRTLNPGETVYVTKLDVKKDAIHLELLTQNVTTLRGGEGIRYRAELVFHIPSLDAMTPAEVKKSIDAIVADSATANAVESKTIKIGMSTDEVKAALGNPEKIVDLGVKQVYIYKDMKVIFNNAQVADVQ
jgi:hypothetical protein